MHGTEAGSDQVDHRAGVGQRVAAHIHGTTEKIPAVAGATVYLSEMVRALDSGGGATGVLLKSPVSGSE